MPNFHFVSQPSGTPRSGYSARISSAQWTELESFVRALHTEHLTKSQIRERLLVEKKVSVSPGQLQAQMQKWGLRVYKTTPEGTQTTDRGYSLLSDIGEAGSTSSLELDTVISQVSSQLGEGERWYSNNEMDFASRLQTADLLRIGRVNYLSFQLYASVASTIEVEAPYNQDLATNWLVTGVLGCLSSAVSTEERALALKQITPSFVKQASSPEGRHILLRHLQIVLLEKHTMLVLQPRDLVDMILDTFSNILRGQVSPYTHANPLSLLYSGHCVNYTDADTRCDMQWQPNDLADQFSVLPEPISLMASCVSAVFTDQRTCGKINFALQLTESTRKETVLFQAVYWRLLSALKEKHIDEKHFTVSASSDDIPLLTVWPHEVAGIMSTIIATNVEHHRASSQFMTSLLRIDASKLQKLFIHNIGSVSFVPPFTSGFGPPIYNMNELPTPGLKYLSTVLTSSEYSFLKSKMTNTAFTRQNIDHDVDDITCWETSDAFFQIKHTEFEDSPTASNANQSDQDHPVTSTIVVTEHKDSINDPVLTRNLSASSGSFRSFVSISRRQNGGSLKLVSRTSSTKSTLSRCYYMDIDTDLSNSLSHIVTLSRQNSLLSRMSSIREHSLGPATSPTILQTSVQ